MNEIELTQLFVKYAELQDQLDQLRTQIADEILARGESAKIAGVQATYYKPSYGAPNYEAAARSYGILHETQLDQALQAHSTKTITVAWKDVCEALGIQAPQGELKPARVVIK